MHLLTGSQRFQCGNRIYAYANRLDPGQLPSNSAAGLRSNLFVTWFTIPNKNQAEFKGFKKQTTILTIFRKLPSIQRVNHVSLGTLKSQNMVLNYLVKGGINSQKTWQNVEGIGRLFYLVFWPEGNTALTLSQGSR